jgi:hypothetical protein
VGGEAAGVEATDVGTWPFREEEEGLLLGGEIGLPAGA